MDPDASAYRRSVINALVVLAAVVIALVASALVLPYFSGPNASFQKSVTLSSPEGFTLFLNISSTSISTSGNVNVTSWAVNGSPYISNISAANSWGVLEGGLWTRPCTSGWPIGVGLMQGHYDGNNYTQGKLIPVGSIPILCPVAVVPPHYFAFEPHSSKAFVELAGAPAFWTIRSSLVFGGKSLGPQGLPDSPGPNQLPPGVYTVVAADEWGDVLTTNFRVLS